MIEFGMDGGDDWAPKFLRREGYVKWREMVENHNDFPSDLGLLSERESRIAEAVFAHFSCKLRQLLNLPQESEDA